LKNLLAKGLTKNQILILLKLEENGNSTITSILHIIYKKQHIPISTLKSNAKLLKDFNLISYGSTKKPKPAELTEVGKMVLKIMNGV
jgi:hypothetical protein